MMKNFTGADMAALLLRLGLAAIVLFHGGLKVAVGHDQWDPHLPAAVQIVVAWGEVLCGVLLLLGLGSRIAAVGIIIIQAGAIYFVTGQSTGFIGDWRSDYQGFMRVVTADYEYNIALILMAAALVLLGSGACSLDRMLFGRKKAAPAPPAPAPTPAATA